MPTKNPDQLKGWVCSGKGQTLKLDELPLKPFTEDDVEIRVTHCGVCGTDVHAIDSGITGTTYPCVVGHEITGVAERVGANVKHVKEGDNVGVGGQCGCCMKCEECHTGNENLCSKMIQTYNDKYPDGHPTYGGYADRWRGSGHFVFTIPQGMTNELAATFYCAGVTTYSPLKRHGVNSNSKVGIIGIGGLGHFALQWAKAMGAEVFAISHSDKKKDDALKLGADHYINSSKESEIKKIQGQLTHVLCTSNGPDNPWKLYLSLLKKNGKFIIVGLSETEISGFPPSMLILRQLSLHGSIIGSPSMIREMLQFAQKHNVRPWIEKLPMEKCNEAIKNVRQGEPRYRYVLEN